MPRKFLRDLGVVHPLIQAPMGGVTTPELVAAVCNAGGLGSLAAAYFTPDQITQDIRTIRQLTDKPFNVNLFSGAYIRYTQADPEPMLSLLAEIHAALGLHPPDCPQLPPDPFPDQLEAVLAAQPAIFSFTFGIPNRDALARIKARGIMAIGTATTAEEADILADRGVAAIVAQGSEAGAHRGTFSRTFESAMVPTLELVQAIRNVTLLPVIASGGLMNGRDITQALSLGAAAAQLGTAFLPCPESGASPSYRRAILEARTDTTVITRAFSGRPARGLANTFVSLLAGKEDIILPYPLQNALTGAMRQAAAQQGEAGFLSLWAGQGVARARCMPAAELVRQLVEEM